MPFMLKDQSTAALRKLQTEYRLYINGNAKAASKSPKIVADLELAYEALEAVGKELAKRGESMTRAYNPKKKKPTARAANPSQRDAIYDIRNQRPFKASALSGSIHGGDTGRLGPNAAAAFRDAVRTAREQGPMEDTFYSVYSYGTPIAWWVRGQGWCVVSKTAGGVSATTAKHLSLVRQAIGETRTVNPSRARNAAKAASRFVLLDAGPSDGYYGAYDRYTLICTKQHGTGPRAYYEYLGFGPGVSGHGEMTASEFRAAKAEGFRSLGHKIKVESLPPTYRRMADSFMADCG
jgi:hypothetical protein